MTHSEFYESFARNMEAERIKLGKSQKEMAKLLDISLSTYKRIVNNQCSHIDIYISYKLFEVCQRLTFEMVEYNNDIIDAVSMIKTLSPVQLEQMTKMIKHFKEDTKKAPPK